ncbi:HNH endonuclease [Sporomusa acidovorans]|uniref:Uncharacterized protein n=1 Tax=Sporomusa acidovorans (strain ATCC 49682 / DSM 3132 / Mol) TaxID=1123286 RepID=A0ABZ3J5A4_SPOA4|nr:HNH endonuclease [Sporomusa acidovorans]OZC14911.1 hypothetical protein SPACI_51850 [Sporomusa acidovorans DSM 3132]SDF87131.1 hypothetical protein SAMN04488499_11102 [Sporomusa acidovorans]
MGRLSRRVYLYIDPEVKALLKREGLIGIKYKNGIPDFSPVSKGKVEIEGMTANRRNNFALADEALAQQRGVSVEKIVAWRKENNLTWHECNDTKTPRRIKTAG